MMLVGCGIIPPTEVSIQMKALVQEMNTKDINKGSSSHHNKTTALIHMGPHKTGTTTLQAYSKTFINQLKEDGYHLPFDWAPDDVSKRLTVVRDQRNAMSFASCFLNSPEAMRNQDPCAHEYVRAGANIAAEGKSMLVTSEGFSLLGDHALKSLATYATASFDEVIVVVFYRRHFEWFVSFFNECWKNRIFGGNNFHYENSILWFTEMFVINGIREFENDAKRHEEARHTFFILDMLKKHFENVKVVNMHDDGKDNNEEFFCEIMPHANRTCEGVRENVMAKKEIVSNPSIDLIYGDLAYKAMKQGMVQIQNHEQMTQVTNAVQKHQLETLGLTKHDFPLTCPSSEVLDQILSLSLTMEETLFPEFYRSPQGEESLRASFQKYAETKLCTLADEAVRDPVWIDFFKSFSY